MEEKPRFGVDLKKGFDGAKAFAKKAGEISKKAISGAQTGFIAASDKFKDEQYQARLKKYNPLFEEEYLAESFDLPELIMIVDPVIRKDIDVCEGSIGWTDEENGVTVLTLYDTAAKLRDIHFVPEVRCNTAYCVDRFDRSTYVDVSEIFMKAQKAKLAELQYIAQCLGAKSFSVDIMEAEEEQEYSNKAAKGGIARGLISADGSDENNSLRKAKRSATGKITFSGAANPVEPELKWFAKDEAIKELIAMRCDTGRENKISNYSVRIDGSTSSTISRNAAAAVDSAFSKINVKAKASIEGEAVKEISHSLVLNIEF